MLRKALLLCGVLSSLLYVATDVLGALRWEGYSYASQSVSELMAVNAPSRPLVVPLFLAYDLLLIGFGFGVRASAGGRRPLRFTGALLVGIGVVGLAATPFFPMHLRGAEKTLTDTMHVALTGVIVLCTLLAVGFGAAALGKRFRLYSIVTIVMLIAFGALAGTQGPRIDAQLPTPWLGVAERINIDAYLLWVLVLSIALLRVDAARPGAVAGRRIAT